MAQSEAASEPPLDGVFEQDLPCVGCGYNLRGLAEGGVCPECGLAARLSQEGDRLAHAPADYVRRLRSGVLMMLGALGAAVQFTVVNHWGVFSSPTQPTWVSVWLLWAPLLAALGLGLAGVWQFTGPEPRQAGQSWWSWRGVVRVLALGASVWLPLWLAATLNWQLGTWGVVGYTVYLVAITVAWIGVWVLMWRLAARIPARALVIGAVVNIAAESAGLSLRLIEQVGWFWTVAQPQGLSSRSWIELTMIVGQAAEAVWWVGNVLGAGTLLLAWWRLRQVERAGEAARAETTDLPVLERAD